MSIKVENGYQTLTEGIILPKVIHEQIQFLHERLLKCLLESANEFQLNPIAVYESTLNLLMNASVILPKVQIANLAQMIDGVEKMYVWAVERREIAQNPSKTIVFSNPSEIVHKNSN